MKAIVRNERGMALALTIFALVVVGALVAGALFVGTQEQRVGSNHGRAEQSFRMAELGVAEGDLVRLTSRRNSMVSAARISDRVARGQVFVPFHFREAAANLLTNPVLDPYAKMAELKICAVRIEPATLPATASPPSR